MATKIGPVWQKGGGLRRVVLAFETGRRICTGRRAGDRNASLVDAFPDTAPGIGSPENAADCHIGGCWVVDHEPSRHGSERFPRVAMTAPAQGSAGDCRDNGRSLRRAGLPSAPIGCQLHRLLGGTFPDRCSRSLICRNKQPVRCSRLELGGLGDARNVRSRAGLQAPGFRLQVFFARESIRCRRPSGSSLALSVELPTAGPARKSRRTARPSTWPSSETEPLRTVT